MFWFLILVSCKNIEYSRAVGKRCSAWKVSNYGVFSGPHFPAFSPNAGKYGPQKKFMFGHISDSDVLQSLLYKYCELVAKILKNKSFPFHRHFFF